MSSTILDIRELGTTTLNKNRSELNDRRPSNVDHRRWSEGDLTALRPIYVLNPSTTGTEFRKTDESTWSVALKRVLPKTVIARVLLGAVALVLLTIFGPRLSQALGVLQIPDYRGDRS